MKRLLAITAVLLAVTLLCACSLFEYGVGLSFLSEYSEERGADIERAVESSAMLAYSEVVAAIDAGNMPAFLALASEEIVFFSERFQKLVCESGYFTDEQEMVSQVYIRYNNTQTKSVSVSLGEDISLELQPYNREMFVVFSKYNCNRTTFYLVVVLARAQPTEDWALVQVQTDFFGYDGMDVYEYYNWVCSLAQNGEMVSARVYGGALHYMLANTSLSLRGATEMTEALEALEAECNAMLPFAVAAGSGAQYEIVAVDTVLDPEDWSINCNLSYITREDFPNGFITEQLIGEMQQIAAALEQPFAGLRGHFGKVYLVAFHALPADRSHNREYASYLVSFGG